MDQGEALGSVIGIQREGVQALRVVWVYLCLIETMNVFWFVITPPAILCPQTYFKHREILQ